MDSKQLEAEAVKLIVKWCKENIPDGHLRLALLDCTYIDIYDAESVGVKAFDYYFAQKYMTHEQIMEAAAMGINIRNITHAHDCYFRDGIGIVEENRAKREAGAANHVRVISTLLAGYDPYHYAILSTIATEEEITALLEISRDIEWYAQLRLKDVSHEAVMRLIIKNIPLELMWKEMQSNITYTEVERRCGK